MAHGFLKDLDGEISIGPCVAFPTSVAFPAEELFFTLVQCCCKGSQVAFVHCLPLEHAVYRMDATQCPGCLWFPVDVCSSVLADASLYEKTALWLPNFRRLSRTAPGVGTGSFRVRPYTLPSSRILRAMVGYNRLETVAMALAPFPLLSASPTGCVSEPFGALASSTPPGWGRARWPGTQLARVSFMAVWA